MKKSAFLILFSCFFTATSFAIDEATMGKILELREQIAELNYDIQAQAPNITAIEQGLSAQISLICESATDYLDDFQWLVEVHQNYSSDLEKTRGVISQFANVKIFKINQRIELINKAATFDLSSSTAVHLDNLKKVLRAEAKLFADAEYL